MAELIFLLAVLGTPVLVMWLFWARMRMIRNHRWHDLGREDDVLPDIQPYEEFDRSEGGLSYGRTMNFDQTLSDVGKRAGAMPDIDKTLLGKR